MIFPPKSVHPKGELKELSKKCSTTSLEVDTFEGKIHVEWEPGASVTPMGQLPFFIQFLKTGCRFEPWVEDCPLTYKSNNAPEKVNVIGSLFLSILSGHKRYAHIGTLTGDGVNPKLLGMTKVVSDDSARRGLLKIDEKEGVEWMQHHLQECYEPLLKLPWILDVDVTIKTIYGSQEGAETGYNPHKKGRPSHTYHSYMMANLKLVLDVEVQPGDKGNSKHSLPGLINLLNRLPKECWPEFVRGDCDWGSDRVMSELEQANCGYLFKVKKTANVKKSIYHAHCSGGWVRYNRYWEGKESELKLVPVRKPLKNGSRSWPTEVDNGWISVTRRTKDVFCTALLKIQPDSTIYEHSNLSCLA
ncbi:transposase [Endozoicomonas montiporae]|uniref:transposase n=1 Tax=Endozoicomonas montiporae TaxID=1027273 RepID=UPI000AEC94C0